MKTALTDKFFKFCLTILFCGFLTACVAYVSNSAIEKKGKPFISKLKEVTVAVNEFPYITDEENYGVEEYWASYKEFLARGGGDCEDYAIAKAEVLLASGLVKIEELEIIGVLDLRAMEGHAILRVNGIYYLDNQNNEVYPFLLPWYSKPIFEAPYSVVQQGYGVFLEWWDSIQKL